MDATITISYNQRDGWHVFTSQDLPGLYVASRDASVAFKDVATAIEVLFRLDHKVNVTAKPQCTLTELLSRVRDPRTSRGRREADDDVFFNPTAERVYQLHAMA